MNQIKENLPLLADLFALNLVFIWVMSMAVSGMDWWMVLPSVLWIPLYFLLGNNRVNRSWEYGRHFFEIGKLVLLHGVVTYFVLKLVPEVHPTVGSALFYAALCIVVVRLMVIWFLRTLRAHGYNYRRVIVVGQSSVFESFDEEIARCPHYGYKLLAAFDAEFKRFSEKEETAPEELDIFDYLIRENVDEVFVSIHVQSQKIQSLLVFCQLNGIVVNIMHDFLNGLELEPLKISVKKDGLTPTLTIKEDWFAAAMRTDAKRLLDILFSAVFMVVVASWLFPIIALLIKLESKGPVFFVQRRTGLNNTVFKCHKFRTMVVNQQQDSKQATANDARITRIGHFLRKTSLDEFPQFMDVLVGHMSIVGPRPHMLKHTEEYAERVDRYYERLWIKPGITGLAQSLGFRGEIREQSQLDGRISHDRQYLRKWSIYLDLKIIIHTAWNMVSFQRMGV